MNPYKVTIVKGSNFFKIKDFDNDIKKLAFEFTRRFIRLEGNKISEFDDKPAMTVFAAALKDRTEFRFHINAYNDWIQLLNNRNVFDKNIKVVELPAIEVVNVDLPFKEGWVARDYQEPIIEYLTKPLAKNEHNKFVGIATGLGKGFCSIKALSQLAQRTLIVVRPVYIEKWVTELQQMLNIPISSIMVIKGGKHLQAFLEMCDEGGLEDNRIGILSNKTYQNWLKAYEEFGEDIDQLGYPFVPDELYSRYKAGIRLIDEVHQDFHLCFKADLYTHNNECISLSATLDTYDPVTKRMYELAYPPESRGPMVELPKYIDAIAVSYYVDFDKNFKTTEYGQTSYSHNAFEKSIIRNKEFLFNYENMIKAILDMSYIKKRQPGDKAIVFASTIAMCDKLTEYLSKVYPDLDVRRFCEDDPIENLHKPDIRVTNIIKSGTGHDIKNLITTVLTIALNSLQSNLQVFGRLRQIKDKDTEFYYLTCQDIQKHKNYHLAKMELLKPKSKSFSEIQYPKRL